MKAQKVFTFLFLSFLTQGLQAQVRDYLDNKIFEARPIAIDSAEFTLDKKPVNYQDLESIFKLSLELIDHKKYEQAKENLNHLISMVPEFVGSYFLRGICNKYLFKNDSGLFRLQKDTGNKDLSVSWAGAY